MFRLGEVVPWGRSYDEYRRMFDLGTARVAGRMLDCAAGPASFNAEASARGMQVVSSDPLYRWTGDEIRRRIDQTFATMLAQTRANRDQFRWTDIDSVEALGELRRRAMNRFLGDYEPGVRAGRYIAGTLPRLPFAANTFALALCSHFLFLYSDRLDARFHLQSLLELARVAAEVRVFPLLDLQCRRPPHLMPVVAAVRAAGLKVTIRTVAYEFQRGGNQLLRVTGRAARGRRPAAAAR